MKTVYILILSLLILPTDKKENLTPIPIMLEGAAFGFTGKTGELAKIFRDISNDITLMQSDVDAKTLIDFTMKSIEGKRLKRQTLEDFLYYEFHNGRLKTPNDWSKMYIRIAEYFEKSIMA